MEASKVYFIKDISPDSIIAIYKALNRDLQGKIGVKISSGEAGGHNYLDPHLIQKFVNSINGTLCECNTVTGYKGSRATPEVHWKTIEDHGYKAIAPFDLMDEEGEITIPVKNGHHLHENYVGSHIKNYQSFVILSHFKGHGFAGFGGAMKNVAIGMASPRGKGIIHCFGDQEPTFQKVIKICKDYTERDYFLESMAESASSILDFVGHDNFVYINVANKLSVDCDCSPNPADPEMGDIGIFASIDPIAVDQACVDAVYNSEDPGKAALIQRMEEKHGIHILEAGEK